MRTLHPDVLNATLPGLADAASHVRSSVVQVCPLASPNRATNATGSGVVWRRFPDGAALVVSNAHVASTLQLRVIGPGGSQSTAMLIARDPIRDLALMSVAPELYDAVPARRARRLPLRAGEFVVAVGHPFGVKNAVSSGVVHAVGPVATEARIPPPQGDLEWVQADVRLGPGSSGGPLVDADGNILGINTMIVGGLALAVPLAAILAFVETAVTRGAVARAASL